jgi:hypothetical protein
MNTSSHLSLASELKLNYRGIFSSDPAEVLTDLIDIFEEGHLEGAVIHHRGEEFTLHTLGQVTAVLYTVLEIIKPDHPRLEEDDG